MEIETIIDGVAAIGKKINEKLGTLGDVSDTAECKKYNQSYNNICKTLTIYNEHQTHMNTHMLDECVQLLLQRACDIPGMPKYNKNMSPDEL
ncbi:hypothetical protein EPVG_00320 [Emiliania huxleyi virus 201]|nr:hypothetical protein ELVG_00302 [Emiliania huxleyi virus 203]AEP15776.1 hypothetical protein EQVG_00367 [Emiliania huxleyi virus 207]AEP16167.1 hypothetical protein ERVG_00292 [Emiliania huxleyi virus 208]AET98207.1 hypothetical protein EPVG_00320 [Emiliania huxleyi virus 201]